MAALHDRKIVAALLFAAAAAWAQDAPKPPGYRLGDAAAPTEYEIRLAIDPKQPTFAGETRIAFRVREATPIVWMHASRLAIESVEVTQGERKVEVEVLQHGDDYLGLESKAEPFAPGEAVARFRYRGRIDAQSFRGLFRQQSQGESYVVSQHEEVGARRVFPCFDEPGWKTPFTIIVDAPAANVVVSNSPETQVSEVEGRAGWKRHEFAKTKPLPTYLTALAVGPFDVVDGGTAGVKRTPLRYLAAKGRGADTRYAREVTPRLLEILEEYFGTPFPFDKLDSLALPESVTFGAMENVGLVTYGVQLLLATPLQETPRFRRSYTRVAAHEIAHMWFGNLATMAWWDDIWLNESFATWIGKKATYTLRPEWDTGGDRASSRSLAIALDRLDSARPVRNPVASHADLAGLFDGITYDKGGAVLDMFEAWIGEARFRDGVREYLRKHAWGSATSRDFFAAIAAASGRGPEVTAALEAFVDQSGVPLVDAELACGRGSATLTAPRQRFIPKGSKATPRDWVTPACFRTPDGIRCEISPEITLPSCPAWVLGNARGIGYYVTRYGPALAAKNLRAATSIAVPEAVTWVSDSTMLATSGLLPATAALDIADAGLRHRSPVVQLAAIRLLRDLRDELLEAAAVRKKRALIAQRVQPLARSLGWAEKPKESEDTTELRAVVLPFAARSEGGAPLRKQAHDLAVSWMRDRSSVSASMVSAVLDTAARFADRATYDLLESLAITSKDPLERRRLQAALATVHAPALRSRALMLTLQKRGGADILTGREARTLLRDALQDDDTRAAAFEFVRANFDALVAKLPEHSAGLFPAYVKAFCSPADRDAFVALFKDRAAKYEGGQRQYDQALEGIELCIAARG
jgi:cytosol alanyl aminopeptidase